MAKLRKNHPLPALQVVHLGKFYPPASGGIETHTRTLALAQAAAGAAVRVIVVNHATPEGRDVTFNSTGRTAPARESDGSVSVIRVGRWASLARLDVAPSLLHVLRRHLRHPPDVWHLHAPNVTMMLAILATPQIRPLVVTHHSDIVRQRLLRHAVRPVEAAVYRRAVRVFVDSPTYLEGSTTLKEIRSKVEVLPLGLDLAPFQTPSLNAVAYAAVLRQKYPGPIWLSVGRLVYYKALAVALEALREVTGTLVVVGTGPMEQRWRELAVELGVADRVVWHGRTSDDELVGAYHAATALWFPSNARSESFGLVQVEAMASGCPIVNTAIPHSGVSWVSRDGETGLTVPVNNPQAFAAAARRLLEEPGLRDRLATEARRQAADRFDHRVMARRSLEIYQTVIEHHRGRPA